MRVRRRSSRIARRLDGAGWGARLDTRGPVSGHYRGGLRERRTGTDLDQLGAGEDDRDMAGTGVVGLASGDLVGAVGVAVDQSALPHIAPMRALATVVWQPTEQWSEVRVHGVALERDRDAVHLVVTVLVVLGRASVRRRFRCHLRHIPSLR